MFNAIGRHLSKWWHVHTAAFVVVVVALLWALGVFAGAAAETYFGVHLTPRGQEIYKQIEATKPDEGGRVTGEVQLTQAQKDALAASAAEAAKQLHPNVQATPEPVMLVKPLPTNFSDRPAGARYLLLVAHDTESPNAPGIQDLLAIFAWFSNPAAQASANYVDDADGNILKMVDPEHYKAWHVAYFNPWAIGMEQVGYASQKTWPLAQIQATARVFASDAKKYGIPIQAGKVVGCKIVTPGIVFHAGLGLCGGGHHDPGVNYPLAKLVALTKLYANAKPPAPHVRQLSICHVRPHKIVVKPLSRKHRHRLVKGTRLTIHCKVG